MVDSSAVSKTWVNAQVDYWKAREATVVATMSGAVQVQMVKDGATPTRWFPSALETTPNGTNGVLIRVHRDKTVFVPMAMALATASHTHDDRYFTESESDARFAPISHNHDSRYYTETEVNALLVANKPQRLRAVALSTGAITSAGTREVTGSDVTFTGLTPGQTYQVNWTCSMIVGPQASGTNRLAPGVRVESLGLQWDEMYVSTYLDATTTRAVWAWSWGGAYTVAASGNLKVVAITTWNSGSVTVLATRLNVDLQP